MKKVFIFCLILLCSSCFIHKGQLDNRQCRPKKANFKLAKIPFIKTNKLVFNKVYIIETKPNSLGYIFSPDGKIMPVNSKDGFTLKPEDIHGKTWDNTPAIGYWRVAGNKIKTEYFSCSNSGNYIKEQGEIKGDTIFLKKNCGANLFKKEKCFDKYIISDMSFQ